MPQMRLDAEDAAELAEMLTFLASWLSPPAPSAAGSAPEHHDYQAWIDNDRRLRELRARLEELGAAALEANPRWQRKSRSAPGETSHPTTLWARPR